MILAAISDDRDKFRSSYDNAVRVMASHHGISRAEARDRVARSYSQRHPIRAVFRSVPSEEEYRQMLGVMNPGLRQATIDGINSFNKYAEQIGARAYFGRQNKKAQQTAQTEQREVDREPEVLTLEQQIDRLFTQPTL
jgi:hypothetical protein